MPSQTQKKTNITNIQGDWLARDGNQWRVNIPTHNGHKLFPFAEYGGTHKALVAADKFKRKMLKQYEADLEYKRKHGELPDRGPRLHLRNRSGVTGVAIKVTPRRYTDPLIEYVATWRVRGRIIQATFSTARYPEAECFRLAKLAREHKTKHPQTLLNAGKKKPSMKIVKNRRSGK